MALTTEAALRKDRTTAPVPMQHRHYATIAAVIKGRIEPVPDGHLTSKHVAEIFAQELAATNPRFDRRRFLTACGF